MGDKFHRQKGNSPDLVNISAVGAPFAYDYEILSQLSKPLHPFFDCVLHLLNHCKAGKYTSQ
jgi:hypothetical protein